MACSNPFYRYNHISHSYSRIPCGWCLSCRIDRRNYYRDKFEYSLYKDFKGVGVFSFLSYDDNHIPTNSDCSHYSLRKSDSVKFIKRVRSYIKYHNLYSPFISKDFKFICVGEYGDLGRPHMHLLFAGIDFSVADDLFRKCWKNAVVFDNGPILQGGVNYVLKYLDKQQHGDQLDVYYDCGIEAPYMHCSHSFGNGLYDACNDGYYEWHKKKRPLPVWVKNKRLYHRDSFVNDQVADFAFRNGLSYDSADLYLRNAKLRALNIKHILIMSPFWMFLMFLELISSWSIDFIDSFKEVTMMNLYFAADVVSKKVFEVFLAQTDDDAVRNSLPVLCRKHLLRDMELVRVCEVDDSFDISNVSKSFKFGKFFMSLVDKTHYKFDEITAEEITKTDYMREIELFRKSREIQMAHLQKELEKVGDGSKPSNN